MTDDHQYRYRKRLFAQIPKLRWIAALAMTVAITTSATAAHAAADDITEGPSLEDIKKFGDYGKAAYGAYQFFFGEKELTLEAAMAQILSAINTAKTEILTRIDQVSASTVSACARHAVIDFANLDRMDSGIQLYTSNAVQCVSDAWARIPLSTDLAAVDQMGFALNVVGPLALISQANAFGADNPGRGPLVDTIVQANHATVTKLQPHCFAGKGEIVGDRPELDLFCTAYNGDVGTDYLFIKTGDGIPANIDYSAAITTAAARTSTPVALASLDGTSCARSSRATSPGPASRPAPTASTWPAPPWRWARAARGGAIRLLTHVNAKAPGR